MKWLKYGAYALLGIVALATLTLLIMGRREGAGRRQGRRVCPHQRA